MNQNFKSINTMKKKVYLSIIALVVVLSACNNSPKSVVISGNDRDAHNCIQSSGYTWSELKKSCVRIFEAGTEFNAYGKNIDSTLNAYVIISDDKKKAEVFAPSNFLKESVILDKADYTKGETKTLFENKQKIIRIDFLENKLLLIINNEPVFYQNYSEGNLMLVK
jgi:hypothetical protein